MGNVAKERPELYGPAGLPRKGWLLRGSYDAGQDSGEHCSWCGTAIRYVFHLEHPDEDAEDQYVGCVCTEYLTQDYVTPRLKERVLRTKDRWIDSPRWHLNQNGNYYRRDRGVFILIYQHGPGWRLRLGEKWGQITFPTLSAAKLRALEVLVKWHGVKA